MIAASALDAFYLEHLYCGERASGVGSSSMTRIVKGVGSGRLIEQHEDGAAASCVQRSGSPRHD